jgi:hypothetical protein
LLIFFRKKVARVKLKKSWIFSKSDLQYQDGESSIVKNDR